MNSKIYIIFFFFVLSCATYETKKKEEITIQDPFSNKGFALLFEPSLKKNKIVSKSIDDRSLIIFQRNLKKDASVKITNLLNNKSLIAKVGSKASYPEFYNSVVSERIFSKLKIDHNEPYVEITALDTNSIFVANKAKTFDEEKNVANKAPVEGISINDLNANKEEKIIKKKNNTFNYVIKIADFYFKDTADLMIKRIKDETSVNKVKIMNISNTSYRVYIGPYKDLNSLQKAFNDIRIINFENLELIKQ